MLVFWSYEIIHHLVESALTGTLYFILHAISFMKCGYEVGRDDEKVWCGLMSAFWEVKIDSAQKISPDGSLFSFPLWFFLTVYVLFWCGDEQEVWCLFSCLWARSSASSLIWVHTTSKSNLICLGDLLYSWWGEVITGEGNAIYSVNIFLSVTLFMD